MLKNIPHNVKLMISAFIPLISLVILGVIAFKFGIGKISEVRAKVSQEKNDLNVLQAKLNLLEEVRATVSTSSNLVTVALPPENPVLIALNQLRESAFLNGLIFENAKTGSESVDTSGLSVVDITFDVSGERAQIFEFLATIPKMAPISIIDKVKLSESGGGARATIIVSSLWAELPTTLPKVDQAISDLTPDEEEVLTEISQLIKPAFAEIAPGAGGGKTDPFSF